MNILLQEKLDKIHPIITMTDPDANQITTNLVLRSGKIFSQTKRCDASLNILQAIGI